LPIESLPARLVAPADPPRFAVLGDAPPPAARLPVLGLADRLAVLGLAARLPAPPCWPARACWVLGEAPRPVPPRVDPPYLFAVALLE
jgi:hypothetical protein